MLRDGTYRAFFKTPLGQGTGIAHVADGQIWGCDSIFISETVGGGFLLELDMVGSKRQKMAEKLTWLEKKQSDHTITDLRKDARIIPASPHSTLIFADGAIHRCFVIDMSVSGVAVSADVQPQVGMTLAVGACVGRVVRILPDGFAVKFAETQNRSDLNRLLVRDAIGRQAVEALRPRLDEAAASDGISPFLLL